MPIDQPELLRISPNQQEPLDVLEFLAKSLDLSHTFLGSIGGADDAARLSTAPLGLQGEILCSPTVVAQGLASPTEAGCLQVTLK